MHRWGTGISFAGLNPAVQSRANPTMGTMDASLDPSFGDVSLEPAEAWSSQTVAETVLLSGAVGLIPGGAAWSLLLQSLQ